MAQKYRNRVVEVLLDHPVDQVHPCPWNWREHPEAQVEALNNSLDQLGIITAMLTRRRSDGELEAIDGHLRRKQLAGQKMTVIVTDLKDESEAKQAILNIDPIAAMARTHIDKLAGLRDHFKRQSPELRKRLEHMAGLRAQKKEPVLRNQYYALIECDQESTQKAVLEELARHELNVRAVSIGFSTAAKPAPVDPEPVAVKGKLIVKETTIKRSARVMQLEGQFDLDRKKKIRHEWKINLNLDRPWQIGLIVGPSGAGKTTIARELWGDVVRERLEWPGDAAIIDSFPEAMSIADITGLLSSVGFSSPPSWRKPYQVLSNGERFRVDLARMLAESPDLSVVDEFTSVVDRQVAQIGSAAVAKTIRATGRRFVGVTCHYDVIPWLCPDWVYDVATGALEWRSLRRRPEVSIQFRRVGVEAWPRFAPHHYLTREISKSARCVLASVNGQPAAFVSFIHYPHQRPFYQIHRVVCLPDYQGVGIGTAALGYVAGCAAGIDGRPVTISTSHPAFIASLMRRNEWRVTTMPCILSSPNSMASMRVSSSSSFIRPVADFRFRGQSNKEGAEALGFIK